MIVHLWYHMISCFVIIKTVSCAIYLWFWPWYHINVIRTQLWFHWLVISVVLFLCFSLWFNCLTTSVPYDITFSYDIVALIMASARQNRATGQELCLLLPRHSQQIGDWTQMDLIQRMDLLQWSCASKEMIQIGSGWKMLAHSCCSSCLYNLKLEAPDWLWD